MTHYHQRYLLVLHAMLATFAQCFLTPSFVGHRLVQQASSRLFSVDFDDLMDMDVVVYSLISDDSQEQRRQLGAIQEDGTLSPLSVWSEEPAFGSSLEFLVDEEDRFPGLTASDIILHSIIPQDALGYGSRQVGGGKGPGNPHGEESELLYYVEQDKLEGIALTIKPELEITW